MNANEIRESISRLRYELQAYHNNASKGGANRQRNMAMLAEDIARREALAKEAATRRKSINDIMNQANRLMSVCNTVRNFNRANAIRETAFRYYDNIRACAGRFNYNDDSEYNKEYSRAQYMNAYETIANTPANLAKLHALAVNGSPMFYIWLDAVDDAATTSVYLTEDAARADIARLESDDKEAGIYEPDAYRIINATPYFV